METAQGTWDLGSLGEVNVDSQSSPGSVPVALTKSLSEAETLQSMETTSPGSDTAAKEIKDDEYPPQELKDQGPSLPVPPWQARHAHWQHWQLQQWHYQQRMVHPPPPLHFQPPHISLQPPSSNEVQELEGLAGKKFHSIQELENAMKHRSRSASMEKDPVLPHNGHSPSHSHGWSMAGGHVGHVSNHSQHLRNPKSKLPLPPPPPPPPPPSQVQAAQLQSSQAQAQSQFQGGMTMQTGTVRRLFPGKGFGFVARDDGGRGARHGRGDVFLHFSDLEPGVGSSELAVGARVKFYWEEPADAQRGPGGRARRVSLTELPEPAPGVPPMSLPYAFGSHPVMAEAEVTATTPVSRLAGMSTWSTASSLVPARPRHTGRVYRRESLLAVEAKMRSAGHLREPRPVGVPRLLPMPNWYWDNEGCVSEDETDDEARLRALEARLDRENGADAKNFETFGEAWAVEAWTFEDALAANQRIAAHQRAGLAGPLPAAGPARAAPPSAPASAPPSPACVREEGRGEAAAPAPTMILQ